MSRGDPVRRLAEVASNLAPALVPTEIDRALEALAEVARSAFGATAASIAVLDEEAGELEYRAAVGPGAEELVQLRLALGQGLAGYVASTGQSLSVGDVRRDPRFAAEVAERTGYVPTSLAVVPVVDLSGQVIGVLSILDATEGAGDLALAGTLADAAAAVIPVGTAVRDLGATLLRAIADAVSEGDHDLAASLRRRASHDTVVDTDLARLATLFAELRSMGERDRHAAVELLETFTRYARSKRRR